MNLIKTMHRLSTWLVLAVGGIHTLSTVIFYDDLNEAAIWFAGAGMGGIFVAFLNFALWQRGSPSFSVKLTGLANVLFIVWLTAGFVAAPAVPAGVILAIGGTMALSGLILSMSRTATETE